MMKSILAKINLAFHLLIHFLKKLFPKRKKGIWQFVDNYRKDRLIPLTSSDKDWMDRFSRCMNCGLCDAVCPALQNFPRHLFPGPSYIVTTLVRSPPTYRFSGIDLSWCEGCHQCEKICPNLVPIKKGIEFIQQKMEEEGRLSA
jgi:succinate dehydrogenase/fumarate reductase-like Fe-S protein